MECEQVLSAAEEAMRTKIFILAIMGKRNKD